MLYPLLVLLAITDVLVIICGVGPVMSLRTILLYLTNDALCLLSAIAVLDHHRVSPLSDSANEILTAVTGIVSLVILMTGDSWLPVNWFEVAPYGIVYHSMEILLLTGLMRLYEMIVPHCGDHGDQHEQRERSKPSSPVDNEFEMVSLSSDLP